MASAPRPSDLIGRDREVSSRRFDSTRHPAVCKTEPVGTVTLSSTYIDTRPEPQPKGRCPVRSAETEIAGRSPTCHDERVSDDLVSVLWTSSLVEAEIAKGRLEAESIPVQLVGEGADDPFPVGPAELLVPSRFEEEARRILAQSEDGSDRP
jgi:Putative prokaryotic signal transducing protein